MNVLITHIKLIASSKAKLEGLKMSKQRALAMNADLARWKGQDIYLRNKWEHSNNAKKVWLVNSWDGGILYISDTFASVLMC